MLLNKLNKCLELQQTFNAAVNPDWKRANYNWARAIWIEAAEASDHVGYKWWKNVDAPINVDQFRMELVDILHFYLSMMLIKNSPDLAHTMQSVYLYATKHTPKRDKESLLLALDELAHAATSYDGDPLTMEFFRVIVSANMTLDEIVDGYLGKNALNFFRLNNGYKTGEYVKIWNGKEDNEVLAEIVAGGLKDFDEIYSALTLAYKQITTESTS